MAKTGHHPGMWIASETVEKSGEKSPETTKARRSRRAFAKLELPE
jgi:hypothetical protein